VSHQVAPQSVGDRLELFGDADRAVELLLPALVGDRGLSRARALAEQVTEQRDRSQPDRNRQADLSGIGYCYQRKANIRHK
jgi:hypothetical protein